MVLRFIGFSRRGRRVRDTRTLDTGRLTGIRGGTDLGIQIAVVIAPFQEMSQQHNEVLIAS